MFPYFWIISLCSLWADASAIQPSGSIQESYSTKSGQVRLVFDLTVGMMQAQTNEAASSLDIKRDAVLVNIKVNSFKFSNPILEQQFKDVYMETDKYPETSFVGKIKQKLNFKSTTPQRVEVEGHLGMHGVSRPRTIPATMTFSGDKVRVQSEFVVRASEHKIDIPLAFFNAGKDEIKIVLDLTYTKDRK